MIPTQVVIGVAPKLIRRLFSPAEMRSILTHPVLPTLVGFVEVCGAYGTLSICERREPQRVIADLIIYPDRCKSYLYEPAAQTAIDLLLGDPRTEVLAL